MITELLACDPLLRTLQAGDPSMLSVPMPASQQQQQVAYNGTIYINPVTQNPMNPFIAYNPYSNEHASAPPTTGSAGSGTNTSRQQQQSYISTGPAYQATTATSSSSMPYTGYGNGRLFTSSDYAAQMGCWGMDEELGQGMAAGQYAPRRGKNRRRYTRRSRRGRGAAWVAADEVGMGCLCQCLCL